VPWSPVGQGFLTGKITESSTFDSESDLRAEFPRFTPEAIRTNRPVLDLLNDMAARKQATPVQIALAWLLAQKPWIVPIPGTTKLKHLEENLGAAQVELSDTDLRDIRQAFATIRVQGERLSEQHMASIDR
jgi:aryl-alcohol dehydrogenase-like predicted oxidoreductase